MEAVKQNEKKTTSSLNTVWGSERKDKYLVKAGYFWYKGRVQLLYE